MLTHFFQQKQCATVSGFHTTRYGHIVQPLARAARSFAGIFFSLLAALNPAGAQQTGFEWIPQQASTQATQVDALFNFLVVTSAIIGGGVCLLIVAFVWKYRSGSHANRTKPPATNWKLESAWIGIPVVLSIFTFVWAARVFFDMYNAPPNSIPINVTARQWFWQIQHPEGQQELNALHVPVGRPVKLVMTSVDVIHSFYIPAFRIKQDVLPGRITSVWFEATQPGTYHLLCAQYCGTQHANMGGWLYAMEPADYANWLKQTGSSNSLARQGELLFTKLSCAGCHGPNPSIRAPSLDGIYGKPVPLANGYVTVADERYLYDSIVNPGQEVVAGYKNVMPSYKGVATPEQLMELVAYIRWLGQGTPHEHPLEPLNAPTKERIKEQQQRTESDQIEMTPRRQPSTVMPDGAKRYAPDEKVNQTARPTP